MADIVGTDEDRNSEVQKRCPGASDLMKLQPDLEDDGPFVLVEPLMKEVSECVAFSSVPAAEVKRLLRINNADGTPRGYRASLAAASRELDLLERTYESTAVQSLSGERLLAIAVAAQAELGVSDFPAAGL